MHYDGTHSAVVTPRHWVFSAHRQQFFFTTTGNSSHLAHLRSPRLDLNATHHRFFPLSSTQAQDQYSYPLSFIWLSLPYRISGWYREPSDANFWSARERPHSRRHNPSSQSTREISLAGSFINSNRRNQLELDHNSTPSTDCCSDPLGSRRYSALCTPVCTRLSSRLCGLLFEPYPALSPTVPGPQLQVKTSLT